MFSMNSATFADEMCRRALDTYNSLKKTGKPNADEWTVLCTIAKEYKHQFQVVALGTGTKCIGKSSMSANGCILNDSHAEVICRRAFLRYLYNEMLAPSSDILYINTAKQYQLVDDIKFHFYSSLMPCGDASIFDTEDYEEINVENREPMNKIRRLDVDNDIHRTGAKCLPDEEAKDLYLPKRDYHVVNAIRTKPGRGDPTLSVSCSDKLCKWIHLGLQGNLMSQLLSAPIFLSSITIGNAVFNEDALKRALYDRFTPDRNETPFQMHIPRIYQSVKYQFEAQKCETKRACPASIAYTCNGKTEIAVDGYKQGVTKKSKGTESARLIICKLDFLRSFIAIAHKLRLDIDPNKSYLDLKQNTEYAKVWEELKSKKFKVWTKKRKHLEEFATAR